MASSPQATLISRGGVSLVERQGLQQKPRKGKPKVEPWVFHAERKRAFDPETPSGLVLLDRSEQLQMQGPGTTPTLLAAYIVVHAGETLTTQFQGGREFYFVIRGHGTSSGKGERLAWSAGDAFYLPAGNAAAHRAESDSVIYVVSDEPLARFLGLQARPSSEQPLHYGGNAIRATQASTLNLTGTSGVVHFGRDAEVLYSSFVPAWKWLVPDEHQSPHRHAAVAVQLFVAGSKAYSIIGDQRIEWQDFTVTVTPAGKLHSHHNEGEDVAIYLVTQDFPLYRHLRTYWHEEPASGVCFQDW
ncbi:cupin domain-containing protein [Cyanobium sp. FGCU-52]|nr:cupin domain-containing protein [Cyanobium sp. FGCU52]